MEKKILFIINPHSGNIPDKEKYIKQVTDSLQGYSLSVWKTTGDQDKHKIETLLKKWEPDMVLVGGGDGTVKLVTSTLIDKDIIVGIIPLGSANGLASCMGIEDFEGAIEAIKRGKTLPVDVLKINDEICLHLGDFGFNAGMIQKFEEGDERGMLAYFKSSLSQIFEAKPYRFEITVDDQKITLFAKMLVIANGTKYGTGATINPEGKMNDGFFEIIAINPEGMDEWLSLSIGMIKEDFKDLDFVKVWKTSSAKVKNLDGAEFQIDGELLGKVSEIDIEIHKKPVLVYMGDLPIPIGFEKTME